MLFNSFQFAVFFIIVYVIYLFLNHKWQNRLLLIASYVFYGSWDWRFLSLILISTVLDYICGLRIQSSSEEGRRKVFLLLSIFGNLAILGFFKYYDFFALSLQVLLEKFGFSIQPHFLDLILPVGISFYTFQTMSYTIDIYRRQMKPTKKFLDFALFVAFFPQLVAGPIERAKRLLPQVSSPRVFRLDWFYEGCYLILWGLFQKVVIADNLAKIVDPVFRAGPPYEGANVLIALYAFAFQIFCDFAGYSNIARGLGRLLGFDIMINFKVPYFSTNPREFWQRWHISLSTWLRDYLYIPLGGNRFGTVRTFWNLMVTMLLGGLWHGAAWTFIIWGAYHGFLLVLYRAFHVLFGKMKDLKNVFIDKGLSFLKVVFFFHLVCLGWLIFRAGSVQQIIHMTHALIFNFDVRSFYVLLLDMKHFESMIAVLLLLIIQFFQYSRNNMLAVFTLKPSFQITIYLMIFYMILFLGVNSSEKFIYFQF